MRTLPEPFLRRMRRLLGDADYPSFLAAYEEEPVRALYLLSGRLEPEIFERVCGFPTERIPYLPAGYFFETEKPGNHPLHHAGAFYIQEPSAMATVSAAPLQKGMRCLDLCAAPGGKAVQLAAGIGCAPGETGFLVANEIYPARCKTLCGNIERMGFANVLVANADAKRVAGWYPGFFDLTLVDAPCSGEGMFRKDEVAVGEWSEGAPAYCAVRQRSLLRAAAETVAPGGLLLYATCTFSEEENEAVLQAFLAERMDFSLQDLPERLQAVSAPGIGLPEARRFYPHLAPGEGQFVALLQRSGEGGLAVPPAFEDARRIPDRTEYAAVLAFLDSNVQKQDDLTVCALGGRMAAADFPVPGENVFSAGVTLGTVEKRRLIPHHQLFKALGSRFYRQIRLQPDDERLTQYLSGAEITCDCPDGWAAVSVCGCTLGGAKVSGGIAKNHYPKGLRLLR